MKSQINIRASVLTTRQLERLTEVLGTSITETVSIAIDRMYQQETQTMKTYTNIDERYGEQTQATIADYQALNPDGKFVEMNGEIHELLSDTIGDYEVVAIEQDIIDTQRERDELLNAHSRIE